ncbi:hypothetical protein QYF36_001579 [Acer negundo]|nr:hypothetical protein QYF36_001579 [Acer negundo]
MEMENQRHHRFQHFHKMICAVSSILLFLLVIKEAMEAAAEVLHVYDAVKLTGSALAFQISTWYKKKDMKMLSREPFDPFIMLSEFSDSVGWSDKIQFKTPPDLMILCSSATI